MPLGSKYIFCVNKSMKQLKKNHEFANIKKTWLIQKSIYFQNQKTMNIIK